MTSSRSPRAITLLSLSLALASCASTATVAAPPPCAACGQHAHGGEACPHCQGAMGGHGAMHGGDHGDMMRMMASLPPSIAAFHEVIRPVWHAEPGAARDANACAQSATLRQRADAIVAAPAPEAARADAPGWQAATSTLQQSSVALVTACEATPRAEVTERLTSLHTAFHALMERVGMHGPPSH
ncbi:MAG: hypothetical protein U0326_16850 [Polyangiales bacterium]